MFKKLRHELNIVFASADKKQLGPAAVTLEQYINNGLLHLQDERTYTIVSQEEALLRDAEIRTNIKQWIRKHVRALSITSRTYTRTKFKETKEDPLGYFYLL